MAADSQDSVIGQVVNHYPRCFGCGTSNPASMGLRAHRDGDKLRAEWTPSDTAEGGPGVVHGGYLAAAVDEVQALLASSLADVPAMTAQMEVRYRAPVLTGRVLVLEAEVSRREGRKLYLAMRAHDKDSGTVCFEGTGLYVAVKSTYWASQMDRGGVDVASLDLTGGDISTFFKWHVSWLRDAYRAADPVQPVSVRFEFTDVHPARWSMVIDDSGLHIDTVADSAQQADATVVIPFATWQTMLKQRTQLGQVVDQSGGQLTGDHTALDRLLSRLPRVEEESDDRA